MYRVFLTISYLFVLFLSSCKKNIGDEPGNAGTSSTSELLKDYCTYTAKKSICGMI